VEAAAAFGFVLGLARTSLGGEPTGFSRRRADWLQFRSDRIGIDGGGRGCGQVAGIADDRAGTVAGWNLFMVTVASIDQLTGKAQRKYREIRLLT
jgi:hypothetical protein